MTSIDIERQILTYHCLPLNRYNWIVLLWHRLGYGDFIAFQWTSMKIAGLHWYVMTISWLSYGYLIFRFNMFIYFHTDENHWLVVCLVRKSNGSNSERTVKKCWNQGDRLTWDDHDSDVGEIPILGGFQSHGGTPIFIIHSWKGFSIINHLAIGVPLFMESPILLMNQSHVQPRLRLPPHIQKEGGTMRQQPWVELDWRYTLELHFPWLVQMEVSEVVGDPPWLDGFG